MTTALEKTSANASQAASREEAAALLPPVDVVENAAGITLFADLPGVPKEKLVVEVEGDTLTIAGEVQLDLPAGIESQHAEVSLPRYRRAFTLSKELDREKISAEFNHGVLKLIIPKVAFAQPRKIGIRIE